MEFTQNVTIKRKRLCHQNNVCLCLSTLADLSLLLAQDPHGRERAMPGLPQGVLGEPRRLHPPVPGAGGQAEGGEEATRPATQGQADGEPEAPGQRQGGAAEPGVRGGPAHEAGRPRGAQTARVLRQVRQDTQGGD